MDLNLAKQQLRDILAAIINEGMGELETQIATLQQQHAALTAAIDLKRTRLAEAEARLAEIQAVIVAYRQKLAQAEAITRA